MFVLIVQQKFALKTTLALSSIVYPVWLYCDREPRIRLSGSGGHREMIPPAPYFLDDSLHKWNKIDRHTPIHSSKNCHTWGGKLSSARASNILPALGTEHLDGCFPGALFNVPLEVSIELSIFWCCHDYPIEISPLKSIYARPNISSSRRSCFWISCFKKRMRYRWFLVSYSNISEPAASSIISISSAFFNFGSIPKEVFSVEKIQN